MVDCQTLQMIPMSRIQSLPTHVRCALGRAAIFFHISSNSDGLRLCIPWSYRDLQYLFWKIQTCLKTYYILDHKTIKIFKMGFALSKWPCFDSVCLFTKGAVCFALNCMSFSFKVHQIHTCCSLKRCPHIGVNKYHANHNKNISFDFFWFTSINCSY